MSRHVKLPKSSPQEGLSVANRQFALPAGSERVMFLLFQKSPDTAGSTTAGFALLFNQ